MPLVSRQLVWLLFQPWLVSGTCEHHSIAVDPPERPEKASGNYTRLIEGEPIINTVSLNKSKLYWYENFNVTTMNQPDRYRKLIISLEPCEGIVYLFVRKTRPCWPNPHSCCRPLSSLSTAVTAPPCSTSYQKIKCSWTHYHSILDGTK